MDDSSDKPPLFRTWSVWYALVLVFLIVLILLFLVLTKKFS